MILIWIALILAFFSLSYLLVKAQKRERLLITRIEILETCSSLQDRDLSDIKQDVNVLLATESISSTVEETLTKIESVIGDMNCGESVTDRIELLEGQVAGLERDCLETEDLEGSLKGLIEGSTVRISFVRERGRR